MYRPFPFRCQAKSSTFVLLTARLGTSRLGHMKTLTAVVLALAFSTVTAAIPMPHVSSRQTPEMFQWGKASWYGRECITHHHGIMANGKRFRPEKPTAASFDYPLGTVLLVTNQTNGRQIVVTVTDRGPARHLHRLLDLSEAAARVLGYTRDGITVVGIQVLSLPNGG